MLTLLVADGNDREGRAGHVAGTGVTSAEAYAAILRDLAPGMACTLINPADADATLPPGAALADYDGLVVTGSTLHVGDDTDAVRRQIALVRRRSRAACRSSARAGVSRWRRWWRAATRVRIRRDRNTGSRGI